MNPLAEALQIENDDQKRFSHNLSDKINSYFEDLNENRLIFVACFSGLLARIVHADSKVRKEEIHGMSKVLELFSNIEYEKAFQLARLSLEEMQNFTNIKNCQYCFALSGILTLEQKQKVVDALFLIAACDKEIVEEEITEIKVIAKELEVPIFDIEQSVGEAREKVKGF